MDVWMQLITLMLLVAMVFTFALRLIRNVLVNLIHRSRRRQVPVPADALAPERLPWLDYALGVGSVMIIVWQVSALLIPRPHGSDRNSGVQANGYNVQLGVEQFARDHGGVFPASLNELAPNYLSALPKTPWGTQQALTSVIPAMRDVRPVQPLGPSQTRDPVQITDLGAIGYTRLPDGRHYLLTGTGKSGNQAIIVFAVSNLPSPAPSPEREVASATTISGQIPDRASER